MWFRRKPKPDPASAVRGLRDQALSLTAEALGLMPTADHPRVWAILMETGYPELVASLFSITDGTTSLYLSGGGGVIGAGAHESVRATLPPFFAAAEAHVARFSVAPSTPPPEVGRVRFYLRTFDGTLTAEAAEGELGQMKHPLSPVFHAGHAVIAAVRKTAGG